MADVYTTLFIILGILLSFPALMIAINLLLPNTVKRAEARLRHTPGRSFALGLPIISIVGFITVAIFNAGAGPFRAVGVVLVGILFFLTAVGSASMCRLLGKRLGRMSNPNSELTHLLRGALVYELAALVPLLGWFIFFPIMAVLVVGSATFSLLRWVPRTQQEPEPSIRVQVDGQPS